MTFPLFKNALMSKKSEIAL